MFFKITAKFVPPRYRGAIFCHLCFYESELGFHASWTTCLYLSLLQSAMCLESFSVTDKIVRRAIQRLLNPLMQAFDEEGFRLLPTLRHESLHYPIHVNERAAASKYKSEPCCHIPPSQSTLEQALRCQQKSETRSQ